MGIQPALYHAIPYLASSLYNPVTIYNMPQVQLDRSCGLYTPLRICPAPGSAGATVLRILHTWHTSHVCTLIDTYTCAGLYVVTIIGILSKCIYSINSHIYTQYK